MYSLEVRKQNLTNELIFIRKEDSREYKIQHSIVIDTIASFF